MLLLQFVCYAEARRSSYISGRPAYVSIRLIRLILLYTTVQYSLLQKYLLLSCCVAEGIRSSYTPEPVHLHTLVA